MNYFLILKTSKLNRFPKKQIKKVSFMKRLLNVLKVESSLFFNK